MKKKRRKIIIQLEEDDSELVNFLQLNDEVPFNLPEFFELPIGSRDLSKRAKLLMLAGLKFLKEKYPKSLEIEEEKSTKIGSWT